MAWEYGGKWGPGPSGSGFNCITRACMQVTQQAVGNTIYRVKVEGETTSGDGNGNYRLASWTVNCRVGHSGGNESGGSAKYDYEKWVGHTEATYDFTRKAEPYDVTVHFRYWTNSGSMNGKMTKTITVPRRGYDAPNPPKALSMERVSDSQHRLTWQGDYTDASGAKPWRFIYVERQVDDGRWEQLVKLKWDAINFTDNGTSAGHRYRYRLKAENYDASSGYAYTGYSFTTPAAPSVSVAKTSSTSATIHIDRPPLWVDSYEVEVTSDGGKKWNAVTHRVQSGNLVDDSAPAGKVTYRVRAIKAGLKGPWGETGAITTVTAPGAPAITQFPSSVVPTGTAAVIGWSRNHPDGTAQSSAQVAYQVGTASEQVITVEGSAQSVTLPGTATASQCSIKVRVRTKGLDPSWGAWSSYRSFSVAVPPQAHFTSPAADGASIESVPFTVEWAVSDKTGVASQALTIRDADGRPLHAVDLAPSARSFTFSAASYLPRNLSGYTVVLSVRSGSSLAVTATRAFSTDYSEPAAPTCHVTYDEAMAADIVVDFGGVSWGYEDMELICPDNSVRDDGVPISGGATVFADGSASLGDVLPTQSVSVVRLMPDGSQWLVGDGMADGQAARDPLPPLNSEYAYLVTAYSSAGTATSSEVAAIADSRGMEAYNFGPAAERCIMLGLNATGSESVSFPGEVFHFALGPSAPPLPTFYRSGEMDVSGRHGYEVYGAEDYASVRGMAMDPTNAVCWFRDAWGGRHRVVARWGFSYDANAYMRFSVDADLTEVVFEEAYGE